MDSSGNSGVWEEFRRHDLRLTANHDAIGTQRERTAGNSTKIEVITTELRETREDIGQMNIRLSGTTKAFYTAAVAMGTMMLSICALIAVLLANGG